MVTSGVIEGVARLIAGYTGYKRGQVKEDDLAVRKKLLSELSKSQENLKNTLEYFHERDMKDKTSSVQKVLDDIDVFNNEIELSEVGHKYKFYDPKTSAKKKKIEKLVEFDKDIVDKAINITEATRDMHTKLLNEEGVDIEKECSFISQYITDLRNKYKDRMDHLKGIGD